LVLPLALNLVLEFQIVPGPPNPARRVGTSGSDSSASTFFARVRGVPAK